MRSDCFYSDVGQIPMIRLNPDLSSTRICVLVVSRRYLWLVSFGEVLVKSACQCPCTGDVWSRGGWRVLEEGVGMLPVASSLLKGKICLKLALSPLGELKVGISNPDKERILHTDISTAHT